MSEKLAFFARALAEILRHSPAAPGRPLRWRIIANPRAGGFTIRQRWKRHEAALAAALAAARRNPLRNDAAPWSGGDSPEAGMILTAGPGHALALTRELLEGAKKDSPQTPSGRGTKTARGTRPFYLIVTAGGDGTSLEVLQALYHAPAEFRSACAVLRLPLGTGNDGADAWELEDALKLLTGPSRVELTRGLKLSTATGRTWPSDGAFPGEPFLAFNILSVGLDAFVTHMTNRMKGSLPGDSYKLWVDIAALLYDRIYRVGPMELRGLDEKGREIRRFREKLLLCAVGAGGRRSYGSHKMILPDERNVCAVRQMSLWRKIALKGLFTTGAHVNKPESILFSAAGVEISGEHPVLAQMDGETVRLEREDFPAVIELTEAVIPVLRRI